MFGGLYNGLRDWGRHDKNRSLKVSITIVVLVIGIILLITDYRKSRIEITDGIERNTYGKGEKTEELVVRIDNSQEMEIEVEISEQMYGTEDITQLFERCIEKIEQKILADNESLDYVTSDLNLISELEDEPVEISWSLDDYTVMNVYGELEEEKITENGMVVQLSAVLTYTEDSEQKCQFTCSAVVYPKELNDWEKFEQELKQELCLNDINTQRETHMELPDLIEGKQLSYYQKMNQRGLVLIFMSILIGVLFYAQNLQNQAQEKEKKKKQMMRDYPEIINKLTLFLGAGMNIKRAWRKIVQDYDKDDCELRFAYEEMKMACREMESGITESESYERFGKRCNIQEYIRLGALLSQNMRKGTKGLNQILRLEAIQALENRKAAAKKSGEEAGTKLLLPMFIMLAEVLVMVIVPAFLTMQM